MALQFRRGTDSDRLTITPGAGEPIWSTDTEKLYVGDGTTAGGIAVGNDSAEINVIIQNKLGNVSGNIIPDTDSAYDLGSPTNKFKDLYLSGNSIYLGDNLILRNDGGTLVAEDSSATPVSISLSSNTTSDLAEGSNLYYTTARADSDAKNAISASGDLTYNSTTGTFSVTTYKSADFDTDLGTKTTADLTEGSNLYFTDARADARVEATADSAYVQARQIKYTNADFADSAFVTTQINNLIDGAPGTLDTLNEIAAALNDDESAYSTLVSLINAKTDFDSTDAIALIDSAYVQARQTTYDFLDSSEAIALIDSAYVQARQTTYDFLDSAEAIALIDSAYVQARQTTGTDSAATISLIQANSVDSAEVINLIDSAYIAARTTAGTDSAAIINLIDSAYVAARTTAGTDSAAVSAIIINDVDTAYIAARANDIILQIDSDLTTTDSAQVVHSFNKTTYRTIKYTAQLENDDTNSYHAEEILLTHDGTNIAISSYAKITLDSDLGEFDAQINGNNVELILTPSKVNTHVKLRAITMSEGAAYSSGLIVAVDSDLTTTDSAQTIHTFDKTTYRTMKYVAQLGNTNGYHAQELLLTHNGTNVALTGYAKILLDSELGTFDALINGNNVELKVSPTYANTNVRLRAIRTLA